MNGIKRKTISILLVLAVAALCVCLGFACVSTPDSDLPSPRNYDENAGAFVAKNASPSASSGINFAQGDPTLLHHSEIINVVIFICFDGETPSAVFSPSVVSGLIGKFNGETVSLFDYYRTLSYGAFSVRSVFPGDAYAYVYQAPRARSYYASVTAESGTARYNPESELLNAAVTAANNYFDFNGITLDANNDGYVDSVSFVVSGAYNNPGDWGHLLWPHAWNLDRISSLSSSKTNSSTLNGVKVDSYTLTFAGAFQIGLIAHEFGHLVGLPDLYHYNYDKSYLPVGYWDLMHLNCNVPQFTLSYLRGEGYLNFLGKKQVPELTVGGTYSLKPTVAAKSTDVVAYKITLTSTESIWLEYRRNDPVSYDRELPGSGLLVYRINSSADGNTEARHNRASAPDEVFIYRAEADVYPSDASTREAKEKYNLSRAALSPMGISSIGSKTVTASYSPLCLYFSSGKNTGIVVHVTEMTEENLTFTIDLGDYDCSDVSDSYVIGTNLRGEQVKNEHYVYYGDEPDISVYLKYKNRQEAVELFDYTLRYDTSIVNGSTTAYAVFSDAYGERSIPFTLYVYDVAEIQAAVISPPTQRVLRQGEALDLTGLTVEISYRSGAKKRVSYDPVDADKWRIAEGLNINAHGTYDHVKVYCDNDVYCILSGIRVLSDLTALRVETWDTHLFFGANFPLTLNVTAIYFDGTEETLAPAKYTLAYDENATPFEKTAVIVTATENPEAKATVYLYPTGNESVTAVSLSEPYAVTLNYGELPTLEDRFLRVTFSGGFIVPDEDAPALLNYASEILAGYSPTKTGKQHLTAGIGSVSFGIDVTVLPKSNALIATSDAYKDVLHVDENTRTVLLYAPMTLSSLEEALTPYSNLRVVFSDAKDGYELNVTAFGARKIGTETVALTVYSAGNVAIASYDVYLLGDVNGDGEITDGDVEGWLNAILSGKEIGYPHLDANGDGRYTLSDLVLLLGRSE